MNKHHCSDDLLLFLYKEVLLVWEARPKGATLPRGEDTSILLDMAGIAILSAANKEEMNLKLQDHEKAINTLFLLTNKKAISDKLFQHLRNSVAHGDFCCGSQGQKTIEFFHEYNGSKNLIGTVRQSSLKKLIRMMPGYG